MLDKKYRHARPNKGLRELAEKAGYTPGEFSLMRFAEDAKKLSEWKEYMDAGRIPPELSTVSRERAKEVVDAEIADLIDRERAWLPFFYPQFKSQDLQVSGDSDSPLTIQIVKYGEKDADKDAE